VKLGDGVEANGQRLVRAGVRQRPAEPASVEGRAPLVGPRRVADAERERSADQSRGARTRRGRRRDGPCGLQPDGNVTVAEAVELDAADHRVPRVRRGSEVAHDEPVEAFASASLSAPGSHAVCAAGRARCARLEGAGVSAAAAYGARRPSAERLLPLRPSWPSGPSLSRKTIWPRWSPRR